MSNLKSVSWGNDIPRSKWDDTEESGSSSSENSGRTYTRQPDVYIQLKPEVELKQTDDSGLPAWMWIALGVAGVVGLGFMGTGLCGYFKVGALSTMGGCSYLCMTAGGLMIPMGVASLIKLAVGSIKVEKEIKKEEDESDVYFRRVYDDREVPTFGKQPSEDMRGAPPASQGYSVVGDEENDGLVELEEAFHEDPYVSEGVTQEEIIQANMNGIIPPSIDNPHEVLDLRPNQYAVIPIGEDRYEIYKRVNDSDTEYFTTVEGEEFLKFWTDKLDVIYERVEVETDSEED